MSIAPRIPILKYMTSKRRKRFWSRVDQSGGPDACWPWIERCMASGYGVMTIEPTKAGRSFNLLAHRVAKTITLERDIADLGRHSCDNPPCCNPAHILEGSNADNMADMRSRDDYVPSLPSLTGVYGPAHPAAKFDAATRARAVELCLTSGRSHMDIAQEIGCHRETLHRWLWEAHPDAFARPKSVERVREPHFDF